MTKSSSPSPASPARPHRRDISARQDLLGRELRQLFDGYSLEDVPDELLQLAQKLESAFASPATGATETAVITPPAPRSPSQD